MMKLHIENEKTKPENLGLEGRLNPGFGFEKKSGLPGFSGSGKPGLQTLIQTACVDAEFEHMGNVFRTHTAYVNARSLNGP